MTCMSCRQRTSCKKCNEPIESGNICNRSQRVNNNCRKFGNCKCIVGCKLWMYRLLCKSNSCVVEKSYDVVFASMSWWFWRNSGMDNDLQRSWSGQVRVDTLTIVPLDSSTWIVTPRSIVSPLPSSWSSSIQLLLLLLLLVPLIFLLPVLIMLQVLLLLSILSYIAIRCSLQKLNVSCLSSQRKSYLSATYSSVLVTTKDTTGDPVDDETKLLSTAFYVYTLARLPFDFWRYNSNAFYGSYARDARNSTLVMSCIMFMSVCDITWTCHLRIRISIQTLSEN